MSGAETRLLVEESAKNAVSEQDGLRFNGGRVRFACAAPRSDGTGANQTVATGLRWNHVSPASPAHELHDTAIHRRLRQRITISASGHTPRNSRHRECHLVPPNGMTKRATLDGRRNRDNRNNRNNWA